MLMIVQTASTSPVKDFPLLVRVLIAFNKWLASSMKDSHFPSLRHVAIFQTVGLHPNHDPNDIPIFTPNLRPQNKRA